jgi:hypothetical protein
MKGYKPQLGLSNQNFVDFSQNSRNVLKSSFNSIIYHYLKIGERIFTVYTGPSPSNGANISISKNRNYINWMKSQSELTSPPSLAYRKVIYKNFIERNIPL